MNDLTRRFLVVCVVALCAAPCAAQGGASEPGRRLPVEDPTVPSTIGPPIDQRQREPFAVPTSLRQDAQPQRNPQDPFLPVDELPAEEQYPALPLLVGAYAFVLAALFAYVLSIARRLGAVQGEVERLEKDLKRNGRV